VDRLPRPRRPANPLLIGVAVVLLAVAWFVRPWLHGPLMFLWTAPLVWVPPLLVLLGGALFSWRRRRAFTVEAIVSPRSGSPIGAFAIAAVALFIVLGAVNGPISARALFEDTRFEEIPQLPSGGNVRLVPREVAVAAASGGFNSPTEFLSDFAITRTEDGLQWTALRTPEGLVRTFTRKSAGLVTLDAQQTSRALEQVDAEFETAPGLQVTDNLRWRLLKERYFIELGEFVGVVAPDGTPRILVPYTEFRGLIVRRPVLGGVFVVHPDGRIEDLEPEEARRRPEVARSGRLFPVALARQIQDSYAYKRGIWNRFFVHEEQTQITDTETNPQPYLIDFGPQGGTKWVTVAEPYGRAFAANAVFLTDTLTGETQVWTVPRGQSLSGNQRALDAVRALSIPGIVFADAGPQAAGGGRFRVVEPRPVFRQGRLVYVTSIVPQTGQSVSKTVIVDAETNRALRIFDNDTDDRAAEKTLAFLRGEPVGDDAPALPAGDEPADEQDGAGADDPSPNGGAPSGTREEQVRERLDDLVRRQREILRETEELQRELEEEAGAP